MPLFMGTSRKRGADGQAGSKQQRGTGSSSGRGGEVESLLVAVAQLGLEGAAGLRELQGVLISTMLLPAELKSVGAALEDGKNYQKLVTEQPGVDHGPPHVRICLKFMQLLLQKEGMSQEPSGTLKDWWKEKVHQKQPADIMKEVLIFKVRKPQKMGKSKVTGEYAKLQFSFKSEEVEETITEVLEAIGGEVKAGQAPKTPGEREVL